MTYAMLLGLEQPHPLPDRAHIRTHSGWSGTREAKQGTVEGMVARRERILALLCEQGAMKYDEVADACGVSRDTARKDVLALMREGRVVRRQIGPAMYYSARGK